MSKYDNSFKEESIRLALTSPKITSQTARDLGIKENTLYNWISRAKHASTVDTTTIGSSINWAEELNRLRQENARLKEEREILKKFATFIAKEQK
jgi:transposase